MFKKLYGVIVTKTVIYYPVKRYWQWTEERTCVEDFMNLEYESESPEERDAYFKEVFTKGRWTNGNKKDPSPLPTEKPELPKDMTYFEGWWKNGLVWKDPEMNVVYKDIHCIYDRDIYGGTSNKINRRKKPYRREIYTYGKVDFMRYEDDNQNQETDDSDI